MIEALCAQLMTAAETDDPAQAHDLAVRLAHQVLSMRVIQLAHEVLGGGPDTVCKGIEIAMQVLGAGEGAPLGDTPDTSATDAIR